MILLRMIIMNLTVAAVIDGLRSARKETVGAVNKEHVAILVDIWGEYDPMATGWISVTDLVFLLYELPEPMGYGGDFENFCKTKLKYNQREQNQNISVILKEAKIENEKIKKTLKEGDVIKSGKFYKIGSRHHTDHTKKEEYLIHEERNLWLKRYEAIKILEDFNVPYYANNKVHFKDVWKKVVSNTYEAKNIKIEIGTRIKKRIRKGWERKYNLSKQKKLNIHVQKILAAKILLKWIKIYRNNKAKREKQTNNFEKLEDHIQNTLRRELSDFKKESELEASISKIAEELSEEQKEANVKFPDINKKL